jgi:sugar/nucleoside kinase (ribokinase family)
MKILVIGYSIEDHIHLSNEEKIKPGGIYYSILGLSRIVSKTDEIYLITALQKSNEHLFTEVYNKVNRENICWVDEIPKVHIILHDSKERTECYENIPTSIDIDYSKLSDFDGILINMVTGFDVTLEQVQKIRKHFKGLIYLDVHTLSRGFDNNKKRTFRQIENFSGWASSVDLIQCNQLEAVTLFNYQDELKTAAEVLKHGTKCFIVTKGEKGARIYFKQEGEVSSIFATAPKVKVLNKVGCGDIFGSIFFYFYLKTRDVNESLSIANIAATRSAASENLYDINLLD